MPIEKAFISYPDFQLQEVIDPEEFDTNNKEVVDKLNEILDTLNQITDSTFPGKSGADKISLSPIKGFSDTRMQWFLQKLAEKTLEVENVNKEMVQTVDDLSVDTIKYALAQIDLFYLNNKMNMRPVTFNDLINKEVSFDTMKYADIRFHTFRFFRFEGSTVG